MNSEKSVNEEIAQMFRDQIEIITTIQKEFLSASKTKRMNASAVKDGSVAIASAVEALNTLGKMVLDNA
jgi:hypothetical protein